MQTITIQTRIRQGQRQLTADLGGETALMSIEQGKYYCLNGTATRIWQLLEEPRSLFEISQQLQQEFDVSRTACEAAVLNCARELIQRDLVECVDAFNSKST